MWARHDARVRAPKDVCGLPFDRPGPRFGGSWRTDLKATHCGLPFDQPGHQSSLLRLAQSTHPAWARPAAAASCLTSFWTFWFTACLTARFSTYLTADMTARLTTCLNACLTICWITYLTACLTACSASVQGAPRRRGPRHGSVHAEIWWELAAAGQGAHETQRSDGAVGGPPVRLSPRDQAERALIREAFHHVAARCACMSACVYVCCVCMHVRVHACATCKIASRAQIHDVHQGVHAGRAHRICNQTCAQYITYVRTLRVV